MNRRTMYSESNIDVLDPAACVVRARADLPDLLRGRPVLPYALCAGFRARDGDECPFDDDDVSGEAVLAEQWRDGVRCAARDRVTIQRGFARAARGRAQLAFTL